MGHPSRRGKYSRSRRISGYLQSLERIDAFLEKANPELEREKINRAIVLLFGERPDITDFRDASPYSPGSAPEPTIPHSD
jgi:hypothetical protein